MNGGTCSISNNTVSCACPTGFTGTTCETNIDDCTPGACMNDGTCVDGVNSFTCSCLPGYSGAACEKPGVQNPTGINCPSSGRPASGWPLVFSFNGNCFKSVNATGLAADPVNELVSNKLACAVAIAYSDITSVAVLDSMIRTKVVPLIVSNRGLVNTQKIGAIGFSAGGTVAAYLGTVWAKGIDPLNGTDNQFRVGAFVNFYGPLRVDRSHATDSQSQLTGEGGLIYLQESRAASQNADIPNVRQWSSSACYCAARGTSPCTCHDAAVQYLAAYADPSICAFPQDDASLQARSVTRYIETVKPAHVGAQYLCTGARDSNVDADQNNYQAASWWRPESLVNVTIANDGHGFPLSVCESNADAQGKTRPLQWMIQKLDVYGDFPPLAPP
jgi:hypothetical protein